MQHWIIGLKPQRFRVLPNCLIHFALRSQEGAKVRMRLSIVGFNPHGCGVVLDRFVGASDEGKGYS